MFVVHDVIEDWKNSSFQYNSAKEALLFFEDIHTAYANNYRIVEIVDEETRQFYIYEEFKQIFG